MRNALVLVPLCIGLTCGFIVPTSTSEAITVTQNIVTFNQEVTITDEDIIRNNSVEREDSDLHDMKYDKRQELYNEGSEENKTIEERSFIFVNQRWSKLPYETNVVDTKLPNSLVHSPQNLKTASILNVFREDPRENVVPQGGTVHTKYLNDKQEQHMEYNKARNKNYHTIQGIESRNYSKYGINSKHHSQNKVNENQNNFIEFLKTSIVRPSTKSTENIRDNINNKYSNSVNKKHFIEFNTENHNIEAYRNQKQNITKEHKEENENAPFYRNIIQDQYVNLIKEQKLFHLLLEEPVPHKQILYKNHNSTFNLKYCRKCVRLAKLSNLNVEAECDCRCGRYIHLKGRM